MDKLTETIERLPDGEVRYIEFPESGFHTLEEGALTVSELKAAFAELERLRAMVNEATVISLGITDQYSLRKSRTGWRGYKKSTLGWASITDAFDSPEKAYAEYVCVEAANIPTNGVESL